MGSASAPPLAPSWGAASPPGHILGTQPARWGEKKPKNPISTQFPPNFHQISTSGRRLGAAHTPKSLISELRPVSLPGRPPPKNTKPVSTRGSPARGSLLCRLASQPGFFGFFFCMFRAKVHEKRRGGSATSGTGFLGEALAPPVPAPPGEAPKPPQKGAACWDGDLFF